MSSKNIHLQPVVCMGFKFMFQLGFFHVFAGNSKQGLRCKACKLAAHLWCSAELSQQPCNGKVRALAVPLLLLEGGQGVGFKY